jgi:hypothetical protein
MQVNQIRKEYENNYREMVETIRQMGGEEKIVFHKKQKSALYKRLRQLQKREHQLDELENQLNGKYA